jgi:membrane protein DedA with SNARE-associated domain
LADLLTTLESLPPGLLYAAIAALAALESVFPPVPADTAAAFGAFLAGRGRMSAWAVFALTWGANVGSAAAVYGLARRYGRAFCRGRIGRKLVSENVLQHIERQYHRHGSYGIFLSRLLPVWRAVVPPFAGIAGLSAPRTLVPLALASGLWYGTLIFLIATLGANFDAVLATLGRVNRVLAVVALAALLGLAFALRRRLKR